MIKKLYKEYIGYFFSWFSVTITIAACLGIVVYLFINGIGQISFDFITKEPLATMNAKASGGISTPIIGTLLLTFIGMVISFPWSLATAIYLSEYARKSKIASVFKLGIDVLSGLPTIVIAIFGLAVFTNPQFGFLSYIIPATNKAYGRSFLIAGICMAIMVLPFIIKTCEEAIKAVPESYKEASLALGASKWQTTVKVVLPAAKNGILTALTLGIGRIIGETVIVWLTLGGDLRMQTGSPWWSPSNLWETLKGTGSTLTSYIFYTSPAGEGNLAAKAFGASFVLIILIVLINVITDLIGNSRNKLEEE